MRAGHADVAWTSTLVFVGVELDLQGSSLAAINHRTRQGMAALARWRPVLCCRWLPLARRAQLLPAAVWSSLLWGASTWTPTKAMCSRIASWGARAMATIANLRKAPAEDLGAWWRRSRVAPETTSAPLGWAFGTQGHQRDGCAGPSLQKLAVVALAPTAAHLQMDGCASATIPRLEVGVADSQSVRRRRV